MKPDSEGNYASAMFAEFDRQRDHQHQVALVKALENVPAERRQESIARALEQIEQEERRTALFNKLEDTMTDELQRLVG